MGIVNKADLTDSTPVESFGAMPQRVENEKKTFLGLT